MLGILMIQPKNKNASNNHAILRMRLLTYFSDSVGEMHEFPKSIRPKLYTMGKHNFNVWQKKIPDSRKNQGFRSYENGIISRLL